MTGSSIQSAAIVGAGLVGQGWAILFAAAGLTVRIYDQHDQTAASVKTALEKELAAMQSTGWQGAPDKVLENISVSNTLEDAVSNVDYVQESVLERVDVKKQVATQIDAFIQSHTLVGSSSSGIAASEFTADLKNRDRFFVVHPVNPPHLIPVVEIVPAPWSAKDHLPTLQSFIESLGQSAVIINKEIEGFILNRLQGALLNEAWALYSEGYASADDIDKTVRDGLGRRWAFMGPFETISLNAADGIVDYAERLSPLYHNIALSRQDPKQWAPETAQKLASELAEKAGGQERDQAVSVRNQKLMQVAQLIGTWTKDNSKS